MWRRSLPWRIEFTPDAHKQLLKLDHQVARRILDFLQTRVLALSNPRQLGKPLTGTHHEFWSYRVGTYRLLCHINNDVCLILVVAVGHRKNIYR